MVTNPYSASTDDTTTSLDGSAEAPEGELHLRFYVPSGNEFALPAIGIREVLEYPVDRINPVPNVSPLLLGTINVRGRVVWVGDLGQFLDESPLSGTMSDISIIAIEEQGMVLGLAIERIGGMAWLSPQQLKHPQQVSDQLAPFIKGEWLLDDGSSLKLLDQVNILRASRWTV
jgi:purine-binding chemotaxis protein CheW